jgi:hypothetical protein
MLQVFGFDFVVGVDGMPWLLEVNSAPQFGDPQRMTSLRHTLALPMLNTLANVLNLRESERTKVHTLLIA